MKIIFERSGGFSGLRLQTRFDTASLSPQEAHYWREMPALTGFFTLPTLEGEEPASDQFHYRLTVVDAEKEHTVRCSDLTAPDSLQPYLRRLTLEARRPPDDPENAG